MTSNEQFHELFTPAAWEIYVSYTSELKELNEKYQIEDKQYEVVVKALVNHISKMILNQKPEIIDERWIQALFQEIGTPQELLITLGYIVKCWKCNNLNFSERFICNSCGTNLPIKIKTSILKKLHIQNLTQKIFSHRSSKLTLFLLMGIITGVGMFRFPLILFISCLVTLIGIEFYFSFSISKYEECIRFFRGYFFKAIFLLYLALVALTDILIYKFSPANIFVQVGLVPVAAIFTIASLWVETQPRNLQEYFLFIQSKKTLQKRFRALWFIEIGSLMIFLYY